MLLMCQPLIVQPMVCCDTIGGFILKLLGELPAQGVKINFDGIEFEVEEVFSYGITVLHAKKSNPPAIRK